VFLARVCYHTQYAGLHTLADVEILFFVLLIYTCVYGCLANLQDIEIITRLPGTERFIYIYNTDPTYQIRLTIVYLVKSSNFTLWPFLPICPCLFSPISAVLGTSSSSLSSNVFSFLLYTFQSRKISKIQGKPNHNLNTYLFFLPFPYRISPEIIDNIRHLPRFHPLASLGSIAQEIDTNDNLDDNEAFDQPASDKILTR